MPEPSPDRAAEAAEEPFLSWADEPFDPGPRAAPVEERTARALEYIAYQLFHIRLALGEIAAEEGAERAGRRRRRG
jgi:hypothetical protein